MYNFKSLKRDIRNTTGGNLYQSEYYSLKHLFVA